MTGAQWPEARLGMEITRELWNAARAANRANRLRAGPGILLRWTPDGTIISASLTDATFSHPFQVSVTGNAATILPGTVNTSPVLIDDAKLDDDPAPVLKWSELDTDSDGRGYIAVEFACDEKWKIKPETLKVTQVADWTTESGKPDEKNADASMISVPAGGVPGLSGRRTRWPLAMLRRRTSGRIDVYQITMAPLQHRAHPRADTDTARHFFW